MRPVRIIAATAVVVALAVTGCNSRSADQTAAPASSAPSSVPRPSHPLHRWVGRDHNHHPGHPGQSQLRPLPDQGPGGISGHPLLPRLRALRTSRGELWGDGVGSGQGHRRRPGSGLVCGAQRLCRLPLPRTQRHLPGQGPPERQPGVGHLHSDRLTSRLSDQQPKPLQEPRATSSVLAPATPDRCRSRRMTSCWLNPRCLAPTVTAYRRASCAIPCQISASRCPAREPGRPRPDGSRRPGAVPGRCRRQPPAAGRRLAARRSSGPDAPPNQQGCGQDGGPQVSGTSSGPDPGSGRRWS